MQASWVDTLDGTAGIAELAPQHPKETQAKIWNIILLEMLIMTNVPFNFLDIDAMLMAV